MIAYFHQFLIRVLWSKAIHNSTSTSSYFFLINFIWGGNVHRMKIAARNVATSMKCTVALEFNCARPFYSLFKLNLMHFPRLQYFCWLRFILFAEQQSNSASFETSNLLRSSQVQFPPHRETSLEVISRHWAYDYEQFQALGFPASEYARWYVTPINSGFMKGKHS